MVIQRWQNLLLTLSVILMGVFCASHTVYGSVVYLVLNITITVLLAIALSVFKNLSRQISITNISLVLMCASIIVFAFTAYTIEPAAAAADTAEPATEAGSIMAYIVAVLPLLMATLCAALATRFMRKDRALLRSYDRLR